MPSFLRHMQSRRGGIFYGTENGKGALRKHSGFGNVCRPRCHELRFSFENLPILMAGMLFGPVAGVAVGVVADLIGCLLVGYAINPILTVGAAFIGLAGGLIYRLCARLPYSLRLGLAVMTAHLLGSVVIKTVGLAAFYDMPLWILMLWRLLNYLIVGAAEYVLLYFILKNKGIRSVTGRL